MVFHIAVCGPDASLRNGLQRLCMEYFSRRADSCIVEQLCSADELLKRDDSGIKYELYLLELASVRSPEGLTVAAELRRRGQKAPLAFFARTTVHAFSAYRVDAMQYLLLPVRAEDMYNLLDRAVEPEYAPVFPITTADGLRCLTYCDIEYLECTHHVIHFHLTNGEDVVSLSLRQPFAEVAAPLLRDERFLQPHRSYIVNLAAVEQMSQGELRMRSGARIPVPRGRESAVRSAFKVWIDRNDAVR